MDNTHSQAIVLHVVLYFPFYFLLLLPFLPFFFLPFLLPFTPFIYLFTLLLFYL